MIFTKGKKGQVAGMDMWIAVIVSVFLAGFLVMLFSLSGHEMQTSIADTASGARINNETLTTVTEAGEDLSVRSLRDCSATLITVTNASGGETLTSGNYTTSGCVVYATTSADIYNNTDWNVTFDHTYTDNVEVLDNINDTTNALAEATDWFDLIITIGAIIVIMMLVTVFIIAIRRTGLLGGSGSA